LRSGRGAERQDARSCNRHDDQIAHGVCRISKNCPLKLEPPTATATVATAETDDRGDYHLGGVAAGEVAISVTVAPTITIAVGTIFRVCPPERTSSQPISLATRRSRWARPVCSGHHRHAASAGRGGTKGLGSESSTGRWRGCHRSTTLVWAEGSVVERRGSGAHQVP
jgi:hypothetical protein